MDIQSKLNTTQNLLKDLGNAVCNLVNSSPDVFEDETIKMNLKDFRKAHKEATQRLENPTLSIATIGTTSSGKSTIVNALMGRRIAPIEAGEMSGGVLTLKHSHECKLIIEATPEAVWETEEWTNLSDDELYHKIQLVMHSYHEARKKKELIAPQIKAFAPLFPANDLSLSGLPEGIGVEFLDLPGLKSVQDRDNLAVIQPLVGKAFSLVALDYMQVDEQHRQKLLGELKRVVEYLQGRTDSMIFILNRVDNRGSDDLPIEVRLEKLKQEIKEVLSLPELPDVIPFNARLLYYAQCAWGTGALNTDSNINPEVRSKLLKSMFLDCATVIKDNISGDRNLRNCFRNIEDDLEDGILVNDETMQTLFKYALKWSGGEALWNCIRKRMEKSFAELVIFPVLIDVFKEVDSLSTSIDTIIAVRSLSNKQEVENQKNTLKESRDFLNQECQRILEEFESEIKEIQTGLIDSNAQSDKIIVDKLQKKKWEGFQILIDTFSEIKKDLDLNLIDVIQTALKENQEVFDLEDMLKQCLPANSANNLARAYDKLRTRLNGFEEDSESQMFFKRIRAEDETIIEKEIYKPERAVKFFYKTMKECLKKRADFMLQAQIAKFETAIYSLAEEQVKDLTLSVSQKLSVFQLDEAIIADFNKNISLDKPEFPQDFFDLESDIIIDKSNEKEYAGQRATGKTEKSCLVLGEEKEIMENIYNDVPYLEFYIPNFDMMATQWREGINKQEEKIWSIVIDWILDYISLVNEKFNNSINNLLDLTKKALDEQIIFIEQDFEAKLKELANLQQQNNYVITICQQLKDETYTENK